MMATSVPSPDTFFDCLSPRQRTGVRCLRVTHFLLARGGLFQAICLMLWLAERAGREREPPIHPWIIYGHAFVYLVSSTGLSSRFLSRISVYALCAIQVHSAYVFLTAPGLGYQIWLRMRSALRSVAVAGASFRLLSTNQYSSASYVDRLGCGLLGLVSGLLGLLSLPFEATKMHQEAQNHEHAATLGLLNCNAFHWFVGDGSSSANGFLTKLACLADKCSVLAWILMLFTRDCSFDYWQKQGVDYYLQARFLLDDVTVILSILVGSSLPWLGDVTAKARVERDKLRKRD
ncbi:unnamed protein product [Schistocephalus solidus]|uniref:Uncharacterized protein n=1 Tax=Schistocephalus solidus TaxID=70667 RepID=A0A3P7CYX0_SCHSO|nr:unnamed protein product [Schistocephalus solidus]